jgi:hypothetical protein
VTVSGPSIAAGACTDGVGTVGVSGVEMIPGTDVGAVTPAWAVTPEGVASAPAGPTASSATRLPTQAKPRPDVARRRLAQDFSDGGSHPTRGIARNMIQHRPVPGRP